MSKIFSDITKTIGNTPLVKLNRITQRTQDTTLTRNQMHCYTKRIQRWTRYPNKMDCSMSDGNALLEHTQLLPIHLSRREGKELYIQDRVSSRSSTTNIK